MCQLSLRSTLETNTFCRRNTLKPEQATGLANCNWIVHIKAQIYFFFFSILLPILLLVIFQMTPSCIGIWLWVTLTQRHVRHRFWLPQYETWDGDRTAEELFPTRQHSPTAVLRFRVRPSPARHTGGRGLGLTPHVVFSFFPPCSIKSLSVDFV